MKSQKLAEAPSKQVLNSPTPYSVVFVRVDCFSYSFRTGAAGFALGPAAVVLRR